MAPTKQAKTTKSTAPKTPAKAVKATKAAAKPEPVEAAPVPPTPVAAPATNEVVEASAEESIGEQFSQFMSKLQQVAGQFSALRKEFALLEKKCTRELRVAKKLSAKRKKGGNRAPSGFV